jgi:hypothetical protein
MRTFSSYGPVDTTLHYYAPRKELIDFGIRQIVGSNPEKGGHYITVWAPRQTGKTWTLNNILFKLRSNERFDVAKIELEIFKNQKDVGKVLTYIEEHIALSLNKKVTKNADTIEKFQHMFFKKRLEKPLILILDEFDALEENVLSDIVGAFRNIYNIRLGQTDKKTEEKEYLLHGVALIGVRSVLGIENKKGSPFNVQRSLHIPNLNFEEVEKMFRWHERESGQKIEQEVIERLYYETGGQPGLTCWFGELLTEGWDRFQIKHNMPIDMKLFDEAYEAAAYTLPNNNILNIISKAKQRPYKEKVLELFQTKEKIRFRYDEPRLNFLYMNGVIDFETEKAGKSYAKFPSPFVQKRLFNYFAYEIFDYMGSLYDPFDEMEDAVTDNDINIRNIIKRYRIHLKKNKKWIFEKAPRRSDMRVYEAVFHFNLYMYLSGFMRSFDGEVYPEFPTGNGIIDLIVKYADKTYGIEVKTYTNRAKYKKSLSQASLYGKQLKLKEISLIFFVESITDEIRKKYETDYYDADTGVKVLPIFVETGE